MKAQLERVVLEVVTDVGSVKVEWDDASSLLNLMAPNERGRTVREIVEDLVMKLSKLGRDARGGS